MNKLTPMLWFDGRAELLDLMRGPKMAKVMEAFMKMRKFDIAALERAAA